MQPGLITRRQSLMGLGAAFAAAATGARAIAPAACPIHPLASRSDEPVGLKLLLMNDTSDSISDEEYFIMNSAVASALSSEHVAQALFSEGGPHSLAIAVAEFDSETRWRSGWLDIRKGDPDAKDRLNALGREVLSYERQGSPKDRFTYINRALEFARAGLAGCPWQAKRSVLDFMGDGEDNDTNNSCGNDETVDVCPRKEGYSVRNIRDSRDRLANDGVTINGFAMIGTIHELDSYYRNNIQTPDDFFGPDGEPVPSGFVLSVAKDIQDNGNFEKDILPFQQSVTIGFRRKMVLEIAGLKPSGPGLS